jgi:multiple sugar transport system permease protein
VLRRPRWLKAAHLFLAPYVAFLVLFSIVPAVYALLLTFASFKGGQPTFFAAGLNNYVTAIKDFRVGPAFLHVGQFLALSLPLAIILVTLVALTLHARHDRAASVFRTIYFIPGALAGPVVVLLAIFMFNPAVSPFAPLLNALGMTSIVAVAQNDRLPTLFTIMYLFASSGFWIAIFYGALNGISDEIIEAAIIDGAGPRALALSIKLPLIRPYVIYMLILTFASNVQLFAEPQLLSRVRGLTVNPYWSPNQLSYAFAFELGQFGLAAVLSLVMLLIGFVGAILIIWRTGFFQTDNVAT